MKIAKLAVSSPFQEKYRGIGSLMIEMAARIAEACNEQYFACRFITVDADIEHNENVMEFYRKNGFIPNDEMNNKRRKVVSMRKDIVVSNRRIKHMEYYVFNAIVTSFSLPISNLQHQSE
jgi:ribosomal protein S18 acetylase RimI-like enzyme